MPIYTYICNNCGNSHYFNLSVNDRNNLEDTLCPACNTGILKRAISKPADFTFDMNKKIPSDLKLFLDRQKDLAKKGESIVE